MTEGELIEFIKKEMNRLKRIEDVPSGTYIPYEILEAVVDLTQEQQSEKEQLKAELKKKDVITDLMAMTIIEDTARLDTFWCNGCVKISECPYKITRDCVKQYFEKQVESEDKQC